MSQTARTPAVLLFWMALQLSACSALIDVSGRQCENDMQCRERQLGDVCSGNVCITLPEQSMSTVQENQRRDQSCSTDADCSGSTPRCMRAMCVTQNIADMFLCSPPAAPPGGATVKYKFKAVEYVARMAPGNITARACRGADASCQIAIEPTSIDQESGDVEFDLPRGFLGFFEVRSDAVPALSYRTKPIDRDIVDRPLQLSSPETFMTLATLDGAEVDETKGVALLEAFDCQGMPVGGVHFETNVQGTRPFYIVDQVPNHNVSVSSLDAVNNVANGGFLNIEPGFVSFTARYGVGGPILGTFNAAVRANTFTFVDMYF
jgi:hypothetical protein